MARHIHGAEQMMAKRGPGCPTRPACSLLAARQGKWRCYRAAARSSN